MTILIEEVTEGQSATFTTKTASRTRTYHVTGSSDVDNACFTEGVDEEGNVAEIPALGDGYNTSRWYLRCTSIDAEPLGGRDDLYEVKCTYTYDQDGYVDPVDGTEFWTLDFGTQSTRKNTAYSQTSYGTKARECGKLVGVNDDGTVDGADVLIPVTTLTVQNWKDPDNVTSTFLKACHRLTGRYNNASFYGWDSGEVLFTGVRIANKGEELYELEFNFQIEPNLSSSDLPEFEDWGLSDGTTIDISGGKDGWEYLWVEPAPKDNSGTKKTAVRGAYVAKMYKSGDFSALGLTGEI